MSPIVYQVCHPWHWLTYGQNATAVGILIASIVNAVSVIVLVRTLRAVNRQALAADSQADAARKQAEVGEAQRVAAERAALAAEQQVEAANSSSRLSRKLLRATESAAAAELAHSDLMKTQFEASLVPVLVFVAEVQQSSLGRFNEFFLENQSTGTATKVKVGYGTLEKPSDLIRLSQNTIGAGYRAKLDGVKIGGGASALLFATYFSGDNRKFVTSAMFDGQVFRQQEKECTEYL